MTDVHNPQSTSSRALTGTVTIVNEEPVNTGIDVVEVLDENIATNMSTIATSDTVIIMARLDTLSAMKPATKRPTSISSQ